MRALLVGLLLVLTGNTAQGWAGIVNDCSKGAADVKISGCSQIIKSRKLYGKPISKINLSLAYINRGNAYAAKRHYGYAILDYDMAIKLNVKAAAAYNNRGNAYQSIRQYDIAIASYNKAIKLNPKYSDAHYNRGKSYHLKRQYDLAILDYDKAIKLNPKHTRAHIHREVAYKAKNRLAVAKPDKKTRDVSTNHPIGTSNVAYANRHDDCNSKFYDRVIKGCTLIIRSKGESQSSRAVAYYKRGLAYYRGKNAYSGNKKKSGKMSKNTGSGFLTEMKFDEPGFTLPVAGAFDQLVKTRFGPDHSKPIADFTRAIKLNEDYAHAYFARGVAYQKFKDPRAIADFTKVLELNPNYPGAKSNLSRAKVNQKIKAIFAKPHKKASSKKQAQLVQKTKTPRPANKVPASKNTPNEAEAFKNRGNVYFAKGDYQRAIALFTKAIQVDPNYAPAYNNRGNSYGRLGKYAQGIADLTKALALNPNTADVHYYNRAKIYHRKGDFRRAIADYTTAHELNPKDTSTLVNRGITYLRLDSSHLAVKDFQRLITLRPKSAYYRYFFGKGNYYAGKTAKAMSVWKEACKLASSKQTKRWQRLFKKAGHYSGTIDGVCDFGVTIAFASCAEAKCKL